MMLSSAITGWLERVPGWSGGSHVSRDPIGDGPSGEIRRKGGREEMEAYCLKCRTKREMQNAQQVTMKNGKPATSGSCPVCSTKMYRIGKSS